MPALVVVTMAWPVVFLHRSGGGVFFMAFKTLSPERWLAALLCDKAALSIPLFGQTSVHADWRVPQRAIEEHLVYLIVNNTCEGRVGNKAFRLDPGGFLWIMPGVMHELWIPEGTRPFRLYFFKLRIASSKGQLLRLPEGWIIQKHCWPLQSRMAAIIDSLEGRFAYHDVRLRGWLTVLFGEVLSQRSTNAHASGTVLSPAQRQRLQEYVRRNVVTRPAPGDLARELRLSPDYFSRKFRRTYSISPRKWLRNERVRLASGTLTGTGLTISEVANRFGYRDVYHFSRQFKQVFGIGPLAYRRCSGL